MQLKEYCKKEGVIISLKNVGRIVGYHPNYLNAMWKGGEEERVKYLVKGAEEKFKAICSSGKGL